jgi:hypothetical protein
MARNSVVAFAAAPLEEKRRPIYLAHPTTLISVSGLDQTYCTFC